MANVHPREQLTSKALFVWLGAVTVYAIANVAGRLGLGRLIDKTSYKFTYIWCTMFSILASLVLAIASSIIGRVSP